MPLASNCPPAISPAFTLPAVNHPTAFPSFTPNDLLLPPFTLPNLLLPPFTPQLASTIPAKTTPINNNIPDQRKGEDNDKKPEIGGNKKENQKKKDQKTHTEERKAEFHKEKLETETKERERRGSPPATVCGGQPSWTRTTTPNLPPNRDPNCPLSSRNHFRSLPSSSLHTFFLLSPRPSSIAPPRDPSQPNHLRFPSLSPELHSPPSRTTHTHPSPLRFSSVQPPSLRSSTRTYQPAPIHQNRTPIKSFAPDVSQPPSVVPPFSPSRLHQTSPFALLSSPSPLTPYIPLTLSLAVTFFPSSPSLCLFFLSGKFSLSLSRIPPSPQTFSLLEGMRERIRKPNFKFPLLYLSPFSFFSVC